MNLPDKLLAIHVALAGAGVDHAFGGALALAWCTEQACGTIDIDLNLFAAPECARELLAALPARPWVRRLGGPRRPRKRP